MPVVKLLEGWSLRWYQEPVWDYLDDGGKRAICIWHRRAGKDDVALRWASVSMIRRPATYWHMLPLKEQARTAIWSAINPHTGIRRVDEAFPDALFDKRETDMMVICKANGATWQVKGSDNFGSGIGSPPAGVTFSEWALADPNAWSFISPILVENDGWALFITTPRGHNHAERMFNFAMSEQGKADGWFAERLPVNVTGLIGDDVIRKELYEKAAMMGSMKEAIALIDQEYYCSFNAAIPGSYYGDVLDEAERATPPRITAVPHEPNLPVIAGFDLGHADSTAIWWAQMVGLQPRLIDYYEQSGVSEVAFYADVLNGCAKNGVDAKDNRRRAQYHYGQRGILLPHDAAHERLGMTKSIKRQFDDFGFSTKIVPRADIDPGIRATRTLLGKAWIDRTNCSRGIDCLKNYHRVKDEARNAYVERPEHDWSSHGADALRTLAMGWDDAIRPERILMPTGQQRRAALQSRPFDPWRLPSR